MSDPGLLERGLLIGGNEVAASDGDPLETVLQLAKARLSAGETASAVSTLESALRRLARAAAVEPSGQSSAATDSLQLTQRRMKPWSTASHSSSSLAMASRIAASVPGHGDSQ